MAPQLGRRGAHLEDQPPASHDLVVGEPGAVEGAPVQSDRHSAELSVSVEQPISAPARLVRQQFGDVAHHEATGVHRGVEFEVLTDDGTRCRYRQSSKVVGPVRLRQELELIRDTEGPLVNRIVKGGQVLAGILAVCATLAYWIRNR